MEKELLQLEKYIDEIVGLMEDTADNTKLIKEIRTDIDSLKEDTTKTAKEFKAEILDIKELISKVKTIKGEDGIDGRDGKDGLNGKDGKDGRDGVNGEDGTNGKDGINGADGSPDTPKDIKEKLETLKKDKRLDASAIKGIDERFKQTQKDWSDAINRIMLVATGGNNGGGTGTVTGTGEADKLAYWTSATNLSYKTNTKIKSSGQLQINVAGVPVASDDTYVLSLQNTGSQYSWLEFLNNGGTGKGAFIGLDTNSLQFFNWQGGDIQFWTDTSASSGVQRMTIANSGLVSLTDSLALPSPDSGTTTGVIYKGPSTFIHTYNNSGSVSENLFIGMNSGNFLLDNTSIRNTGIGASTFANLSSGHDNFAMGARSCVIMTTGSYNTTIGTNSFRFGDNSSYNTYIGASAGSSHTDVWFNANNSNYNIGIGYRVLEKLQTGDSNIIIGGESGVALTSGSSNIIIGAGIDATSASATNELNIGGVFFGTGLYGTVRLGFTNAPTARLHLPAGSTAVSSAPLKFTSGTLMTAPEAGAIEFLTDKWYGTITTGAAREEFTLNDTALTSGRVPYATTNGRLTDSANITFDGTDLTLGSSLKLPNTTATAGIIFQNSARLVHSYRNNAAKTNFFAGLNAGNLATALTGGDNTGLGLSALNAITTGSRNFAGGTQAGQLLTTGDDNLFFGALAGWQSAVGISRNSVLGSTAGAYMNGSDNIYAGYSTASALTGSYNVLIGNEIASDISFIYNLTGATAIGYQALMVGEGSDYCTAIGYQAGYNDSGYTGCIYIGYQAGGATANDQLFIANDSSGIPTIGGDLTNNKVGINTAPASILARLHVTESTLGNAVHKLESTATNDDVSEIVYQNRVATTNATVTTLHTFTIPASTTYAIESIVIARRTGGASGTAEDGARYKLSAVYKSVAGTATIIGAVTKVADEDQAGWDANLTVSAGTVLLQVTGATNNNITWHTTSRIYSLSS